VPSAPSCLLGASAASSGLPRRPACGARGLCQAGFGRSDQRCHRFASDIDVPSHGGIGSSLVLVADGLDDAVVFTVRSDQSARLVETALSIRGQRLAYTSGMLNQHGIAASLVNDFMERRIGLLVGLLVR